VPSRPTGLVKLASIWCAPESTCHSAPALLCPSLSSPRSSALLLAPDRPNRSTHIVLRISRSLSLRISRSRRHPRGQTAMGEACRCSRANRARQRGSCGARARHAAAAPVPCAAQGRENRSGRQAVAQGPVDEAKSSVDGDMRTGARFKCMLCARTHRERHLGCPAVHGQAPRSQDLWRRDVLPRRHDSCRRPQAPKMSLSLPASQT